SAVAAAVIPVVADAPLRARARFDCQCARPLDRELGKLEPPVVSALRLGAYQIALSEGRTPPEVAVDESVRCARAVGLERATGLVNAVLRRVASEHSRVALPDPERDPPGFLPHPLSLPPPLPPPPPHP